MADDEQGGTAAPGTAETSVPAMPARPAQRTPKVARRHPDKMVRPAAKPPYPTK